MRIFFQVVLLVLAIPVFAFGKLTYTNANVDSLLSVWETMPDDSVKVELLTQLAWDLKHYNQPKSFKIAREALKISTRQDFRRGIADASHTLGMLYWNQGEYLQAADFYFAALSIRESLGDRLALARSYNNIGNVYFHQKKYDEALHYYELGKVMRLEVGDELGLVYSFNNIGDVFQAEKEMEQALNQYEKALQTAIRIDSDQGKAFVSKNLGDFQLQQQAFIPAFNHFNQGYVYYKKLRHQNGVVECLNGMAKTLVLQKKDLSKSLEYSMEAIRISRKINAKSLQAAAQINLAATYEAMGDYKKAFNLERKSRFLQDEIVDESRERAIIETQVQYDVEKQESAFLKQENELLQKRQELSQLQMSIVFFFLFGAIIIGALIYSRLRTQASMNAALAQKNEELEQSNQALERFAYVASHDLKEPLRTIGSFTTLLQRRYQKQLDEEGREYVDYIVSGVSRMYALLEDLLKYSRLIHQQDENREAVNLNALIATVKDTLDHRIKEKAVAFDIPPMPFVVSNATQMQQLFQNLLNNAIKFNDNDQPKVSIEYENHLGEHLFAVKDNGIGIESQYQDKIFDVFQRLSRKGYEGTGVGLAICKKIVEQHQGRIWVESEEGKGSTFYFTLPDQVN